MLRHKKELRDHQLMKMRRELDAVDLEGKTRLEIDQEWDRICKKYGFSFRDRKEAGRYFSHIVHAPRRTNPKHDSNRRIRHAVINHNVKPLKQQFKEQIKEYDPEYEAFYAAYADGNY